MTKRVMRDLGLSRRFLLQAGLSLSAGAAVWGPGCSFAGTSGRKMERLKVGDADVLVLSDGTLDFPPSLVLPDEPASEIAKVIAQSGGAQLSFEAQANLALIRIADRVVLVDSGGGDFMPTLGLLPDALPFANLSPDDVTDVIFTHAHPDHLWGLIDPLEDEVRFPRARLWMTAAERDYWLRPGIETQVPSFQAGMALGTQRRLRALSDRLETVPIGQEVIPGLLAIDTAGHTPGHISLHLSSSGEGLVIGGDVLIHPIVSFARPQWAWRTDTDTQKAADARSKLLDRLVTDNLHVLGYHLPWPGLGRVERRGDAFGWLPDV